MVSHGFTGMVGGKLKEKPHSTSHREISRDRDAAHKSCKFIVITSFKHFIKRDKLFIWFCLERITYALLN